MIWIFSSILLFVASAWIYWLCQGGLGSNATTSDWLNGLGTPVSLLVAVLIQWLHHTRTKRSISNANKRASKLENELQRLRDSQERIATKQARPILTVRASGTRTNFEISLDNLGNGPAIGVALQVNNRRCESLKDSIQSLISDVKRDQNGDFNSRANCPRIDDLGARQRITLCELRVNVFVGKNIKPEFFRRLGRLKLHISYKDQEGVQQPPLQFSLGEKMPK